jgi:hypothetical protein
VQRLALTGDVAFIAEVGRQFASLVGMAGEIDLIDSDAAEGRNSTGAEGYY